MTSRRTGHDAPRQEEPFPSGRSLDDVHATDYVELMQVGDHELPIYTEDVKPRWHEHADGDDGDADEIFVATVVLETIGFGDPAAPTLVTGAFEIPEAGETMRCVAPGGPRFLGRFEGARITEQGLLALRFAVLDKAPVVPDDVDADDDADEQ